MLEKKIPKSFTVDFRRQPATYTEKNKNKQTKHTNIRGSARWGIGKLTWELENWVWLETQCSRLHCVPPKRYVGTLTLSSSEVGLIWR